MAKQSKKEFFFVDTDLRGAMIGVSKEIDMMNPKLQVRYGKLLAMASKDMTSKQEERYFHSIVSTLDELNEEPNTQKERLELARIAGNLQLEYPNLC